MALPWVKLHTGLLDNDRFLELSPEARLTFLVAIAYAGKLDSSDGALVIDGVGPAKAKHFSRYTGVPEGRQLKALDDLVSVGFMSINALPEGWKITKWGEKAGVTLRAGNARRQRRHRDQTRNVTPTVTGAVTPTVTGPEGDKDIDAETIVSASATAPERPTDPKQATLALKDQEQIAKARELLDTVWNLLGGLAGTSKSAWAAKGNKPPALDMVQQGVTVEQVTVAWKSASARFGEPVYTMKKVQEEIARLALVPVPRVAARRNEPVVARPSQDAITPDLPAEERAANLKRLADLTRKGRPE